MEILQTTRCGSHKCINAPEFKVAYLLLDLDRGSNVPSDIWHIDSRPRVKPRNLASVLTSDYWTKVGSRAVRFNK